MADKKNEETNEIEFLELELVKSEAKYWEPVLTIDAGQLVNATDKEALALRDSVNKQVENDESDEFISEIVETIRILKAKPLKRDEDGKLELHAQYGIPQTMQHSVEDLRPINRILWAIEDALKGKKPEDAKSIIIKFGLRADLKKPKYSDAEYLANLVALDTETVRGISGAWPVFRDKFVPEDWDDDKEKSSMDGCLLTESKKIQKSIK
jgi:hypothetical protein